MNGIDSSAAALLASRLSALLPVGAQGSAGPMQAGVSALAGGAGQASDAQGAGAPQASTQTVLSAVALALDAIVRSGGDATPAVVGTAPVWSDPGTQPAAAQAVASLLEAVVDTLAAADPGALFSGPAANASAGGAQAANDADGANPAHGTDGTNAANGAGAAAQGGGPLAALASALQRTVSGSGLFYESHIAQWLSGQRSLADLAAEPQNQLVAAATAQLPLDWSTGAGSADDVLWSNDSPAPGTQPQPGNPRADTARDLSDHTAGAMAASLFDDAAFDAPTPQSLALRTAATAEAGDAVLPSANPQGQAVAVHPAVIPLLRQQLDLLATGEFRWTGEAWPGVRLDWSIRQENDDPRRSRGAIDPDDMPWRTRLTLSLPSLGIVDADLTLVGATLAVRVQASPHGAARLAANGEALRGRMAAAGIELGGLSIREVGGGPSGSTGADAARAAHAYAQAASAPAPDAPPPSPLAADAFDWEPR